MVCTCHAYDQRFFITRVTFFQAISVEGQKETLQTNYILKVIIFKWTKFLDCAFPLNWLYYSSFHGSVDPWSWHMRWCAGWKCNEKRHIWWWEEKIDYRYNECTIVILDESLTSLYKLFCRIQLSNLTSGSNYNCI